MLSPRPKKSKVKNIIANKEAYNLIGSADADRI